MDYKSNGFQYHYQYQTLETNLLLDNIFRDTSYMLQSIRYIVKNNFFDWFMFIMLKLIYRLSKFRS